MLEPRHLGGASQATVDTGQRSSCKGAYDLASEAAMFDIPIRNIMEQKNFLSAPPETTVSNAARLMAEKNVGAVMSS